MKLINQFIRKHLDLGIQMDRNEAQSIYNDIIEIWDNFSDGYQWQGKQIKPSYEVSIFYNYLKIYGDWICKYVSVLELQSEDEIQKINNKINSNSNIYYDYDDEEGQKLKKYVNNWAEKKKIKPVFDEINQYYTEKDKEDEYDWTIVSMQSFIWLYYLWLYGFPTFIDHLIKSIEWYFIIPKNIDDLNPFYNTKKPQFDGLARLKNNIDLKKLHEILAEKEYIYSIPYDEFYRVLSNPQKNKERINWKKEEYAAACAKLIFKKYPMMCAEIKFSVKNKILNNRQYTDAKNKKLVPRKEERFKEELREALIDI